MSDQTTIVFLGVNDAGMRVYDWLCGREDVFVHSMLTTKEQVSLVKDIEPDYLISCGYSYRVPENILDIPTRGCLNLHPGYLPYNRGANPNVWSIVEGTPAGVTLHYMDSGIDTGDIISQREVSTSFSDTGKDLHERLEDAQVNLFKEVWQDVVSGNASSNPQELDAGTYHRTGEFEEICRLDPDETVQVKGLINRIRALTFPPYDNAKIEVDGETYYVEINIDRA